MIQEYILYRHWQGEIILIIPLKYTCTAAAYIKSIYLYLA